MNLEESTTQTLWDDGAFVLSRITTRITTREAAKTRLLVSPCASQPSADALAWLENAYGLRARLDSPRFTQPVALLREERRTALILDDPGGAVLSSIDAHGLPLAQVLTLAASMAAALDALHRRELIHNDIRPAHLLVNLKAGSAALTGFGLASSSALDGDAISQPVLFADALPYVAPERTGLVNRRADARSDLYSLGVVIYRMLCGKLPWQASSAAQWLHCHTAMRPIPLSEHVPEIAGPLAAIVERLLAKAAEDRYQSARGVEHDLRLCAEQCRRHGRIEPFALGTADTHERLLIPDRLYGREKDVQALTSVFERVARDGSTEFVLVSGYSGIGKSSLVEDFHQAMSWAGGRFASGKFDQYQRDIPYETIAQCMQTVVQQILDEGAPEIGKWRARIQDAVGPLGRLMLDLIPELERVTGPQPDVPELPPQEAQTRFVAVLTRFIGAFARAEQPLVLFLDDLQWLDSGTASVLEALAKGPGVKHLMLIGAWRDNEVDAAHPLTRVVAAIRAGQVRVHEVLLAPLAEHDVARLVRDATHGLMEQTAEHTAQQTAEQAAQHGAQLARVVFDKTGGNPFFAVQFLQILADEGYLAFDPARREWAWNADRIARRGFPDSVVDLMVGKLGRLSGSTRQVLADFACLGASVSTLVLARVSGQPAEAVDAALAQAAAQGIVYRRADGYAFVHDRIQEAAYALIAETARAAAHLRIGTRLDGGDGDPALAPNIFEVVNQYNRALHVIDDSRVRMRVVALNLRAGRRARASAAYGSALAYLSVGSDILGSVAWQTHYGEKFSLELLRAECEFLTGNATQAEARLRDLVERANTIPDRAAVAFLRVTLHTALDQMQAAIDIGLGYLRHVGIEWVAHPAREAAKAEYASLLGRLQQRPIASLIELPLLQNEALEATLNVLTAVLPPAFFTDENLVCLVLARMANLSIEHGNADASSLGFAYLGMVAGPIFGDYRAGFEFGRLGLALVDERKLARFRARVYMCFAYHVMPWTQPMHAGLPLLRRAFEAAQQSGDLTYIGFSSCCLVTSLLAAGEPLAEAEDQAVERLRIVRAAGFGLIVDIMTAQLSLIRGLRGLPAWLGSAEADHASERALEQHLEGNPALAIAACWYWIRKQEAQYFAGDIAGALKSGERAAPLLWTSSGHFELAEYHFFSALTRLQSHDALAPDQQAANEAALAEHIEKLHGWAGHGPANFASRAALVDAERARTQSREFEAMRLYERAIEQAREQRLRHIEGLANELAARFYLERGFSTIGMVYLRNARQAYLSWGSMAKVRSLDARHPELAVQDAGSAPHGPVANRLDAETVVRASQAISSERVLERLMHTLMSIVLEHAGARRAVLVLPHAEQLCIEAEASAAREGSAVEVGRRPGSPQAVPLAMLHHSLRTHEAVLVDDASIDNPFAADEYFIGRHARSVLCLPLVKQTRLIGALYLENELAPGVFTPSRMAVLKLLASQAAISIENASLEEIEALLEEKEALLHEVHHRVKNNLQLISSLLSLQAARVDDASVAELFLDSRNRVRSMAMVHENLYRAGNFARIDMAPHIRNLCAHLSRAYELSRLDVSLDVLVDDVQLDMNRAVACGMIVNELVSNALKHAFPQGRSGRLRVELVSSGERACRLSVSDDGVGLSPEYSIEQAESLGLQIVSDLSRQLHATIALGRDTGTSFDIHFKL
ncbi:GAF domain-containing protein [Paraburkholderia silviterrae]|uniref:GAF domain-containing protein n=2 Tax=Paraburkholderia silviterrae TaxID=2528715 RepID=A0A4R5M9X2_9BURK|nr:GAF domain-containing protein [Paraburkholderia silviterrae]